MKHHDLGRSYKETIPVNPAKETKSYPSLTITTEQFPPLKGKQVGDTCRIEITAKVVSVEGESEPPSYRLQIRKAATLHGKGGNASGEEKGEGGY